MKIGLCIFLSFVNSCFNPYEFTPHEFTPQLCLVSSHRSQRENIYSSGSTPGVLSGGRLLPNGCCCCKPVGAWPSAYAAEVRGPDPPRTLSSAASVFVARFARRALQRQPVLWPRLVWAPMSTTAWSHHLAGDAWPSLELRRVMLIEVNSRMPEIPPHNTRGVRRHWNKFT